jgi:hypothetical protein
MPGLFHASFTMFVYLRGHHLIEYYFSVSDSRVAANDLEEGQLADDHA